MSFADYGPGLERSKHVGALSAELFSSESNDGAKEALLSTLGFYSAYSEPNPDLDRQRKEWREKNDPLNEYVWNSSGYRDKEFVGPVDILAAGCSQTVGQGVPVEARWSNQLAKKLEMTVATTAIAGWSAQTAINAVMHYITTYGKPKVVALLLPDFFRYDLLLNTEIFQSNWITNKNVNSITRRTIEKTGSARDIAKFIKRPYKSKETIPSEFSYFVNGQILRFFIEYCKEAKIELVWSTWDRSSHEFIDYVSKVKIDGNMESRGPRLDLSNYVNIEYFHNHNREQDWSMKLKELSCHQDLKKKYEIYFDEATDSDRHMGVHLHAHIADKFYKKLKSN
jgi:hypothetical protein